MSHTSILSATAVPLFSCLQTLFPFVCRHLLVRSTNIEKNIILPQGRLIRTGRVDVRRCSCAFFFSQLLVLFYALWRLFAYTSTSCVPFFFCSNKCFYLHRGKCFSQSPVVHKVLRYQRDSFFFFFTRVLRGNIY